MYSDNGDSGASVLRFFLAIILLGFCGFFRFGTPDQLKRLIDQAHEMGISVIMDIVHSHAVKNEVEGLGRFDGTPYQYFHGGDRREHPAWDSLF